MAECKPQPPPPKQLIEVPYEIQDPISHDVMWDPVLLVESGHSYDRPSIQQWFQRGNRTCPRTNRKLKSLLIAVSGPPTRRFVACMRTTGTQEPSRHPHGSRRVPVSRTPLHSYMVGVVHACAGVCGHRAEGLRVQPQTSDAYTTV